MTRCINLDWLEVFCFEPTHDRPCDADFFRAQGFVVESRDYGTRIYNEMFTILEDGEPWIEVRRSPKNPLMPREACHLRLHNRTCYLDGAADIMQQFITHFGYEFLRISRVDICLDFVRFDDNTIPRVFMQRYMRGKFSKINQANIHSHGSDRWTGRVWNSVSWGSPTSAVGTKFYNKTLELYNPKTDSYGKSYIRYAWLQAGLIDDMNRCTLQGVTQEIWRVEFSIRSDVKRWFVINLNGKEKKYQSIRNTLQCYDTYDKLLCMFASLQPHYFRFMRYQIGVPKSDCPERILFRWKGTQQITKVERDYHTSTNTPDPLLLILIRKLRQYRQTLTFGRIYDTIGALLKLLQELQLKQELAHPWSREELLAIQQLMARRSSGLQDDTYTTLLAEVKELLNINDNTAIF